MKAGDWVIIKGKRAQILKWLILDWFLLDRPINGLWIYGMDEMKLAKNQGKKRRT